jgi:flavodoxin long chain
MSSQPLALTPVGIFYGSTNGDTAAVAQQIASLCEAPSASDPAPIPWAQVTLCDIAAVPLEAMHGYTHLIIGAPTWDVGQLQRDWERAFEQFDLLDLTGKRVALFGLGDQVGYPDTFVDALAFFADKCTERGATLTGRWPAVGYTFNQSWALGDDSCFVGLVLDALNQPEKTEARLRLWLAQLRREWSNEDGKE